ncbi:uncharacterized protein ColSpa_00729 [Colletotrichum spaethianum]|uniref:Uncharacterized protein n=1 Tax=Colletotrichum spaethianum TaxID=700344 RepID=A0AA37L6K7_9PEZI|nr:uncharacterized protein ColSpa_00729 [Colletotrichum spaethianum]GKT40548.1 hypothetical protein ColSpa_00729 [Colletotrichum spaethianum]
MDPDAAAYFEWTTGTMGGGSGGSGHRRKDGIAVLGASRNPSMHRGSSRVMDVDLQPNAEAIQSRCLRYQIVAIGR